LVRPRGGHGLPKFSPGPPGPALLRPAGRPPLKRPDNRADGLRLSSTPLDTPRRSRSPVVGLTLSLPLLFVCSCFCLEGEEEDLKSRGFQKQSSMTGPARRGVSKGVEDGRRPPALWAGYPKHAHKAVSGVGHGGPGETLGSLWILLAIRAGQ
jgi:hypothetical protein